MLCSGQLRQVVFSTAANQYHHLSMSQMPVTQMWGPLKFDILSIIVSIFHLLE